MDASQGFAQHANGDLALVPWGGSPFRLPTESSSGPEGDPSDTAAIGVSVSPEPRRRSVVKRKHYYRVVKIYVCKSFR